MVPSASQLRRCNVGKSNAFKFLDADLNQRLLNLLRKGKIKHEVGKDGIIYYSSDAEDIIENSFICPVRDQVFPSWQVLTCPRDWAERYKEYMSRHRIPFHEEFSNGEVWFLLPRNYRPGRWKRNDPMKPECMAIRLR